MNVEAATTNSRSFRASTSAKSSSRRWKIEVCMLGRVRMAKGARTNRSYKGPCGSIGRCICHWHCHRLSPPQACELTGKGCQGIVSRLTSACSLLELVAALVACNIQRI